MSHDEPATEPERQVVLAGDLLGEAREMVGAALDVTSQDPERDPEMHYRTLFGAHHLGAVARGRRGDFRRDLDPDAAWVIGRIAQFILDHEGEFDPITVRKATRVFVTTHGALISPPRRSPPRR